MNNNIDEYINKKVHILGLGGIGMSALALILVKKGVIVSGSDKQNSDILNNLRNKNIEVFIGHDFIDLTDVKLLLISNAISINNPVYQEAEKKGIEIIKRGRFLADLSNIYKPVVVTGTHGKTTVTAMIAYILEKLKANESYVIGGLKSDFSDHAHLGDGKWFVMEADESDASFQYSKPEIAVITNIDQDHMLTYHNSSNKQVAMFFNFIKSINSNGKIILSLDGKQTQYLSEKANPEMIITYGWQDNADCQILDYQVIQNNADFIFSYRGDNYQISMPLIGHHNALNTLGAILAVEQMGYNLNEIIKAFSGFVGVYRRSNIHNINFYDKKITLIDDYGHHPKEIFETVKSIITHYPARRIIHVYQPHRYTRTAALFNDFIKSLQSNNILILLPTFAASEAVIAGGETIDIYNELVKYKKNIHLVKNNEDALSLLENILKNNDVLLIQGAGDIANLAKLFMKESV